MTTTVEEAVSSATLQYTIPEGWTVPQFPPNGKEFNGEWNLYITEVRAGDRDNWVGTFRTAKSSSDGDEWLTGNRRVYGSAVNGTPRDGQTYLVFGKYVVRYNSEYALYARHHSTSPWSVICGPNGEPWPFPNDHVRSVEGDDYIAVDFDMSNLGQSTEVQTWDDSGTAHTYGMAKREDDGTVLLNPALSVGELYLCWNHADEALGTAYPRLAMYVGGGVIENVFAYSGHYSRYREYRSPEFNANARYDTLADRWVKFGFGARDETPTITATTYLERSLKREDEAFAQFNEETNKLAREKGWCSSYEQITGKLGMKSRWHGWWYASVSAVVKVKREGLDGYQARDVLNYLGVSGKRIMNLTMEAEMTFQVKALKADDVEAAKLLVTEDRVREALMKHSLEADAIVSFEVHGIEEDREAAGNASLYNGDDDDDSDDDD